MQLAGKIPADRDLAALADDASLAGPELVNRIQSPGMIYSARFFIAVTFSLT